MTTQISPLVNYEGGERRRTTGSGEDEYLHFFKVGFCLGVASGVFELGYSLMNTCLSWSLIA